MTKGPYGGVIPEFSLDAYRKIILQEQLDGSFRLNYPLIVILWRSVFLAFVTTVLCLLIGFPAAYVIAQQSDRMKTLLLIFIMIPFWSNLLIRTIAWIVLLRDKGPINSFLMATGIIDHPLSMLFTNGAIVVGLVYVYIPFMILPIYTSVERLDKSVVEAAFDLYASRFQVFLKVIVPLTMPGIIAGCFLVLIPSIGAFVTPDLLGGGRKLMIGTLIQRQFTEARDWPYGAALSAVLLLLVIIALLAQNRAGRRKAG
ncbi:MAG: ABC transporter permease [Alphaproteobacteria bacterium]|nr:ABC transporter permease [Alphaproteobacteria bacterium]